MENFILICLYVLILRKDNGLLRNMDSTKVSHSASHHKTVSLLPRLYSDCDTIQFLSSLHVSVCIQFIQCNSA